MKMSAKMFTAMVVTMKIQKIISTIGFPLGSTFLRGLMSLCKFSSCRLGEDTTQVDAVLT